MKPTFCETIEEFEDYLWSIDREPVVNVLEALDDLEWNIGETAYTKNAREILEEAEAHGDNLISNSGITELAREALQDAEWYKIMPLEFRNYLKMDDVIKEFEEQISQRMESCEFGWMKNEDKTAYSLWIE